MKKILLGNEAIVQGALESGIEFVSAYPGTPSSEIGDIFFKIAERQGVYFEFSTNEKVALEAAIGASFSGLKCLVAMKNFGLNVASDVLLPFCYTGTKGPVVIVVADDPSCWSSGQSEENSRAFAYLAHIPILEPSDPQEAKDFIRLGFEISEKFKIPVIVRTTTRVAHQRMPVIITQNFPLTAGRDKNQNFKKGEFIKDTKRFVTMPPRVLEMKNELLEKIEKIRDFSEKSSINKICGGRASAGLGIISSGISYLHIMETLKEIKLNPVRGYGAKKEKQNPQTSNGVDLPVFKLGFFYPLPEKKIKNFIKNLDKVLVVEELEPYLEKEINILAKEVNHKIKIFGKDVLPITGELNSEKVVSALSKIIKKKYQAPKILTADLNKRFPRLCEGCPYWLIFSAVKKMAPEGTIFGGDIGCYMLAGFPPHEIQDYLLCMGSSIGIAHGIKKATGQKLIAFIGDSTFFHAGIPSLVNAVYNKSNPLIIVMDNRITAMTGHQPRPGACDAMLGGENCRDLDIENIVKACGVRNVKTIDPANIKELETTISEFLNKEEVSVIIARHMCAYWTKKIKNLKN